MDQHDGESAKRPPRSLCKRILFRGALLVLAAVVLYLAYDYLQRTRGMSALERTLAELDESDPGWRWEDILAARATIPDEQNSARTVIEAHRLLTSGWTNLEKMTRFRKGRIPGRLAAESLAELERVLTADRAAVAEPRKLADMPLGRHSVYWSPNPFLTLLEHLQNTRASYVMMKYDGLYLAQKGKPTDALRSCRALLNAARSIGDEPLVFSQHVRMNGAGVFASAVERTLALGEGSDQDLAVIAKLAEEEEIHSGLVLALRGERARLHVFLTGLAEGNFAVTEILYEPSEWFALREEYAGWTIQSLARQEHARMLALLTSAIDNTRLPLHEQPEADVRLRDEMAKSFGTDSLIPILLPPPPQFGRGEQHASEHCRKVARMRCLRVLLAVERYRLQTGAWPAKLEELTPGLLKAVPLDPFDGKLLRYRRFSDGIVVYSVGPDSTDDGGEVELALGTWRPAPDVGYRLWDMRNRRQSAKRRDS
jgi:hypothetical protein